ncbi:MAG: hypothetical protein JO040_10065 [Gemmatimonadetes bacterium]|nr:hypothetical protein [Gemmatimonadota bacterium]
MSSFRVSAFFALVLALLAGCSQAVAGARGPTGAPAPAAAAESFMRLAGEKDYTGMGRVFGTTKGSVLQRDPAGDVERRMYAMASVLQNEGFTIRGEEPVPGRVGAAVRSMVRITHNGRATDVPFTMVRGPEGRWYVEEVGLEAVTSPKQ